ncbi:MAG: aminoacyl-tRNA hydrolase [Anaerolineaceae bacterium]|nr:aminoacyl-tRNA hydrolase [Anaerolineaceae bacterium]
MVDNQLFELFKKIKKRNESSSEGSEPFMIVGLGNPGREYEQNRHNIGFMAADYLIEKYDFSGKKVKSKAIVTDGLRSGNKVVIVKPQTYMNLSGEAVGALVRFYKIPLKNLVIIHDDLDLPFGVLRIRPGGGAGGQKGVNSIIQHLSDKEFNRFRIGIGRPPGRMVAADYVLQNFSTAEKEEIPFLLETVYKAMDVFLTDGINAAMNQFNGTAQAEGG